MYTCILYISVFLMYTCILYISVFLMYTCILYISVFLMYTCMYAFMMCVIVTMYFQLYILCCHISFSIPYIAPFVYIHVCIFITGTHKRSDEHNFFVNSGNSRYTRLSYSKMCSAVTCKVYTIYDLFLLKLLIFITKMVKSPQQHPPDIVLNIQLILILIHICYLIDIQLSLINL